MIQLTQDMHDDYLKWQAALKASFEKDDPRPLPMWSASAEYDVLENRFQRWLLMWREKTIRYWRELGFACKFAGHRSMEFWVSPLQPLPPNTSTAKE